MTPAFRSPVRDAQASFRAVLDAMARPGSLHTAGQGLAPPAPLDPATAACLLTLVDGDAPLRLDDAAAGAWDWLAFHCGAVRSAPSAFACALALPDLSSLNQGSDAEPETSTTLILQVAALGSGRAYRLDGPGLRVPTILQVSGLPDDFTARWAANHALYPRGIDIVLCAGETVCGLPRSVHIEEA